jgi:hypothetical protein
MKKHGRRAPEELIRDLESKIRSIRSRAERKKTRAVPAISHALKAIKLIDLAIGSASDTTFRAALQEARTTLTAASALQGVIVPPSAAETATLRGKRAPASQPARVLEPQFSARV